MLALLKPAVRPKPWSGDAYRALVLEAAGFSPAHLRKALQRTDQALDAVTPKQIRTLKDGSRLETESGPDHDIRLRASRQIYEIAGITGHVRSDVAPDPSRPVQVAIILSQPANGHTRALPDAHGVRIHLGGGAGGGA